MNKDVEAGHWKQDWELFKHVLWHDFIMAWLLEWSPGFPLALILLNLVDTWVLGPPPYIPLPTPTAQTWVFPWRLNSQLWLLLLCFYSAIPSFKISDIHKGSWPSGLWPKHTLPAVFAIPQLPIFCSITTNQLTAQVCRPTTPKVSTFAQASPVSVPVNFLSFLKAPHIGPGALSLYPTVMIFTLKSWNSFFCFSQLTIPWWLGSSLTHPLLVLNLAHKRYSVKAY